MTRSNLPRAGVRLVAFGCLAAALASPQVARAAAYNQAALDCKGMSLLQATGVPGEKTHGYALKGTCELFIETIDTSTGEVKSRHGHSTVWAVAAVKWNGPSSALAEQLEVTDPSGKHSGQVHAVLNCTADPMISKSNCVRVAIENTTGWAAFEHGPMAKKARPVLAGVFTLAQATELSKKAPVGGGAPPPPPPAPKSSQDPAAPPTTAGAGTTSPAMAGATPGVVHAGSERGAPRAGARPERADVARQVAVARGAAEAASAPPPARRPPEARPPAGGRAAAPPGTPAPPPPEAKQPAVAAAAAKAVQASLLNVEGEDLAGTGKFLVAGGKVLTQPMAGFGSGWSGDAQLFWHGGSVGAVLDLIVEVPTAATYALEVYLTRAPDYGQLKVEVDQKAVPFTIDAYAPKVMPPSPRQIGKFSLGAGPRYLSFMIVGKNPQSSAHLAGIDRVRLYPVGPP